MLFQNTMHMRTFFVDSSLPTWKPPSKFVFVIIIIKYSHFWLKFLITFLCLLVVGPSTVCSRSSTRGRGHQDCDANVRRVSLITRLSYIRKNLFVHKKTYLSSVMPHKKTPVRYNIKRTS